MLNVTYKKDFDLKNAFGEVHHNLIRKVLEFHHVPGHVIELITNLYTGYHVSILTKEYITNPIEVSRGALSRVNGSSIQMIP